MGAADNNNSSSDRASFGPEVGPEPPGWVKDLYQQQEDFPEETYLQDLLRDTGGDPVKIEANARRKLAESNMTHNNNNNNNNRRSSQGGGEPRVNQNQSEYTAEAQMRVTFEEVDCFSLWIWFEFWEVPSEPEREMLANVLDSWFILGKLGSFNTLNLQLNNNYNTNVSFFNYDESELESSLPAAFHEMEQPEYQDHVGRFWVDLGTCDELAIDVLINALHNFSREYVSIRELQIGGLARGPWTAPKKANLFQQEAAKGIQESILQDLDKIFQDQGQEQE